MVIFVQDDRYAVRETEQTELPERASEANRTAERQARIAPASKGRRVNEPRSDDLWDWGSSCNLKSHVEKPREKPFDSRT